MFVTLYFSFVYYMYMYITCILHFDCLVCVIFPLNYLAFQSFNFERTW